MNANDLRARGWTVAAARARLAGCRANVATFRQCPPASRCSYRLLNASFYARYRAILFLLTANP